MPKLSSFTNVAMIRLIFWAHMAVATFSHIAVFLLIAGGINLAITTEGISFWTKGLFVSLIFISSMYGVNHVTNPEGYCCLTDFENYYRRKEGMSEVGAFMPRFYATVRIAFKKLRCYVKK